MQPIPITYLIPTLDRSGAEKQLTLLATGLSREEFAPEVLALTRGGPYLDELRAANIPVTVLNKRWKCDPIAWLRLRRELQRRRPAILHTWLFAANAYGRLVVPQTAGIRRVVSERCVDSWKSGWQLALDRRLIERTDRLIGNSQSVVEFYRAQGYPADRCRCIPNGVEIPQPVQVDRQRVFRELDLPDNSFVVGYIGRLAPQKRVRDLIWAATTLWEIRHNVRLLIIGDGPERTRLEEFAREVRGNSVVRFLGHREDATQWLPLCDAFWLGSSFEGMSNSVMEAMAAGVPVVATDIPPNRELIVPEQSGFLVKPGDPVGFMQWTRRLMDEPGLGEQLGRAGRERMIAEFSIRRMVERHEALYRELLAAA